MKKSLVALFVITMSVLCSQAQTYVGTMTIGDYTRKDVTARISPSDGQNTVSLTLYGVKFAWLMPVTLDVKIDPVARNGNKLTADGVVPTARGKKYEKYTIRQLTGNTENGNLRISCQMGQKQLYYNGVIKNE